ncbi:hypothetical protein ACFC0N_38785 [Streptomyces zaomyceticus]|uniref:hypothetical protein n=1 Tax=Streptomyces zaomyceticus TaxID=68286 RepID=UPI0035DF9AD0
MATVAKGAETAARNPGMVIMRPAIPSETVKLDPIEVSRPIGRISVVTIEKIPSITEITASQETEAERSSGAGDGAEAVVVVDMNPVLSWTSHSERDHQSSRNGHHPLADSRHQRCSAGEMGPHAGDTGRQAHDLPDI